MSKGYLKQLKSGKLGASLNYSAYADFCNMVLVAFEAIEVKENDFAAALLRTILGELLERLERDPNCPLRRSHYRTHTNRVRLTVAECLAVFIACNATEGPGSNRLILNEIHKKLA